MIESHPIHGFRLPLPPTALRTVDHLVTCVVEAELIMIAVGHCMVEVVKLVSKIGLCSSLSTGDISNKIGLCTRMRLGDIWIEIGLPLSMVQVLNKLGLCTGMCLEDILNEIGLPWSMVQVLTKVGLLVCTALFLDKVGLWA